MGDVAFVGAACPKAEGRRLSRESRAAWERRSVKCMIVGLLTGECEWIQFYTRGC